MEYKKILSREIGIESFNDAIKGKIAKGVSVDWLMSVRPVIKLFLRAQGQGVVILEIHNLNFNVFFLLKN